MAVATVEETYTIYGNASSLFTDPYPEKILTGPAGTGKSRGELEYLNYIATEYPDARILMLRKTRRSLTESGMVTFEQKVLHPAQGVRFSSSQQRYIYPNRSILAVGGMDKASKVLSSEWDIIYVQEANELDESDWEMCSMRLRNNKVPVQQIIGDVNPGPPNHWIKQREKAKKLLLLETYHEDNPTLFDRNGQITPEGVRYLGRLDQLSGVRYLRYRKGLWVSADGMIYEDSWNSKLNLINRIEIKPTWRRWLSIDFGYSNPFVCQWWAQDEDGRLYRYREIYHTKKLVEDHAVDIALASGWFHLLPKSHEKYKPRPAENADPLPQAIICDTDAEDRKTLERHLGMNTTPAKKTVSDGIQAVASRLRPAGDGKPRLLFLRDSLVELDRDLAEAKKPTCFEDEVESYVFKQGSEGPKEEPVKEDDHACLIAGTMVATNHGDVPIEQIHPGDYVWTRAGYRRVKAAGMTAEKAQVYTVHISDGRTLTGTANHPVYLNGQGYTSLHAMRYGDIIEDINSSLGRSPLCRNAQPTRLNLSSTKESHSGAIQTHPTGQTKVITVRIPNILWLASKLSMSKFGKMLMDLCQKVVTFITKMEIHRTIPLKTLNALQQKSMLTTMLKISQRNVRHGIRFTLMRYVLSLLPGTSPKKGERGIASLGQWHMQMLNSKHINAKIARKTFNHEILTPLSQSIAPIIAGQQHDASWESIMSLRFANNVAKSFLITSTTKNPALARKNARSSYVIPNRDTKLSCVRFAQSHLPLPYQQSVSVAQKDVQTPFVVSVEKASDRSDVYNLTVETLAAGEEGEYFANGILVHNCDATRYMVAHLDLQPAGVSYFKNIWR